MSESKLRTLYTGFKGIGNTSFQLVRALNAEHYLLTNSFKGIEQDITKLNDIYNAIVMFGVDKTLHNCIRIESCAQHNDSLRFSSFQVDTITKKCDCAMIPYSVSQTPANYLCNYAYWCMLHKNANAVFIHIPSAGKMDPSFMQSLIDLFSQPLF